MSKALVVSLVVLSVIAAGLGQSRTASQENPQAGFITPSELNVNIGPDVRTFIVMAAVNMAGFDAETAGQPISPARAELRRDLARLAPALKARLQAFYKSHRRPEIDESVDAARYAALSLLMTPPPAFSIHRSEDAGIRSREEGIPDDIEPLLGFVQLVREFYLTSGIRELIPKYTAVAETYVNAYRRPVGSVLYNTVEYFHTRPETLITMRPLVLPEAGTRTRTRQQTLITRNRTRQVFIIPDPLSALGSAVVRDDLLNRKEETLSRRVGDDYIVLVGPSRTPGVDAIRQALIRFVIDPIIERHLKTSLEYKDRIVALAGVVPTARAGLGSSVYLIIRESLAQAAEARMRRIQAGAGGSDYSEDDAVYDLAQAYLRGAVLAFHFYESLVGFEKVGVDLDIFFDQMLDTTKWEREANRAAEFEAVAAKVASARKARPSTTIPPPSPAGAMSSLLTEKILLSDDLIRRRQFHEARLVLDEVLKIEPNNARAVFGMAQVVNQTPSEAENDPAANEDDKIQAQYKRLEAAIDLYRKAIQNASGDSESWLIQWSHVLIGRIFDFQEFRADALTEYEKAIAMGDIPNGAYREALEGKRKPYGH